MGAALLGAHSRAVCARYSRFSLWEVRYHLPDLRAAPSSPRVAVRWSHFTQGAALMLVLALGAFQCCCSTSGGELGAAMAHPVSVAWAGSASPILANAAGNEQFTQSAADAGP